MFQIGPRDIGADLTFAVDLALFILQYMPTLDCTGTKQELPQFVLKHSFSVYSLFCILYFLNYRYM